MKKIISFESKWKGKVKVEGMKKKKKKKKKRKEKKKTQRLLLFGYFPP